MKHAAKSLSILMGLFAPFLCLAQAGILYQEDFGRLPLGLRPAGFTAKGVVKEENGRRYLSCRDGYGLLLHRNMMAYLGAQKWGNLTVSFRFRFTDSKKMGLSLVVKSDGWRPAGVKYSFYYIGIRQDGVDATLMNANISKEEIERCTPRKVLLADKGLAPLQAGQWYSARAVVKDNTLEFFLGKDDSLVCLLSGEVIPGGGSIDWLSYNAVDLADIIVIESTASKENEKP